jgi:hypothetical protein
VTQSWPPAPYPAAPPPVQFASGFPATPLFPAAPQSAAGVPQTGWEGPKTFIPHVEPEALAAESEFPRGSGIVPFRPLGLGDILGGSFRAVRFNPPVMFGLTLAIVLGFQIVIGLIMYLAGTVDVFTDLLDMNVYSNEVMGSFVALFGGSTAGVAATSVVVNVFLTHACFAALTGDRPSVVETVRASWRRIWPVIGYSLLYVGGIVVYLAVALLVGYAADSTGFVVLAVLGLLLAAFALMVKLLFAVPAIVVEKAGPVAAIKRSFTLTKGRFWRTFGVYLLASIVVSLATSSFSQVVSIISIPVALWQASSALVLVGTLAASLLASVLSLPLMAAVTTLLYADARIRGEGFDLALSEAMYR